MQLAAPNKRLTLQLAGYLFFATGFAGMLLPLLPTTAFWIIAAACFAKSAPDTYWRILAWPGVGPAIGHYLGSRVIGRRGKATALAGMAVGAVLIVVSPLPASVIALSLLGIAVAAAYVATRPSDTANVLRPDARGIQWKVLECRTDLRNYP